MPKYLISYDICGQPKNYNDVESVIKLADKYVKVLETTWIVWAPGGAETMVNTIKSKLNRDDRLIVARLSDEKDMGWSNLLLPGAAEFLRRNY